MAENVLGTATAVFPSMNSKAQHHVGEEWVLSDKSLLGPKERNRGLNRMEQLFAHTDVS